LLASHRCAASFLPSLALCRFAAARRPLLASLFVCRDSSSVVDAVRCVLRAWCIPLRGWLLLLLVRRPAGPYKINGVPLRRLNQAYVIATSTQVDVSKVDVAKIDDAFFVRKAAKKVAGKDGEGFFAKQEGKVR
jgi:hypothetical protein